MISTTAEGYPVPQSTDYADAPSQFQAFALAQDGKFPTWDASFAAVTRLPSWRIRTSADLASITTGNETFVTYNTVDFNTCSTCTLLGGNTFQQVNDGYAWWYFGFSTWVLSGGTETLNSIGFQAFQVTDYNPDTNISSTYYGIYGDTANSTSGSEFIQGHALLLLHGKASMIPLYGFIDPGAGATRTVKANSAMWGIRLGNG